MFFSRLAAAGGGSGGERAITFDGGISDPALPKSGRISKLRVTNFASGLARAM
jgi:hypothetical protein